MGGAYASRMWAGFWNVCSAVRPRPGGKGGCAARVGAACGNFQVIPTYDIALRMLNGPVVL